MIITFTFKNWIFNPQNGHKSKPERPQYLNIIRIWNDGLYE